MDIAAGKPGLITLEIRDVSPQANWVTQSMTGNAWLPGTMPFEPGRCYDAHQHLAGHRETRP
jgi:hypothetical protein